MENLTRNEEIISLAEEGKNLAEIGRLFGISRERVRQLSQQLRPPEGYLPITEVARRLGLTIDGVKTYTRSGRMKTKMFKGMTYILEEDLNPVNQCRMCGNPVPFGRKVYCSTSCLEIGNNEYRKMHAKISRTHSKT